MFSIEKSMKYTLSAFADIEESFNSGELGAIICTLRKLDLQEV